MRKRKEITLKDIDGVKHTYKIERYPATVGMEIIVKLPISGLPKLGDFEELKGVRDTIFSYIYNEKDMALETKALIDNHVPDGETALKLMKESLEFNYSFFQQGILSNFLTKLAGRVPSAVQKILTDLYTQSSAKSKPHSKN